MKKRNILSMTAVIAAITLITGCGNGSSSASADTEDGTAAEVSVSSVSETGEMTRVPFEEVSVVDNDQCAIKVTELDEDGEMGYTLTVELENASAENTYMFELESAYINSAAMDASFGMEVPSSISFPGMIIFSNEQLEEYGIEYVTDIELTFGVYDTNDDSGEYIAEETVHIYPYGEENAEQFTREDQETDLALAENDAVKVVLLDAGADEEGNVTAKVYLENKTEASKMIFVENASVDGTEADPYWAMPLPADHSAISDITWLASDLEAAGISDASDISDLVFTMLVYEGDNFGAEIMNETFTIHVSEGEAETVDNSEEEAAAE